MSQRPSTNELFTHSRDLYGAHNTGWLVHLFERFLKGTGVNDRSQHTHIIGGIAADAAFFGEHLSSDIIARTVNYTNICSVSSNLTNSTSYFFYRLGIDPEAALRGANARFERRFRAAESKVHASGRSPRQLSADEWRELWDRAKAGESG